MCSYLSFQAVTKGRTDSGAGGHSPKVGDDAEILQTVSWLEADAFEKKGSPAQETSDVSYIEALEVFQP